MKTKYFYNALHKDFKQRVIKNTERTYTYTYTYTSIQRTLFMSTSGLTSGVSLGWDFLLI